MQAVTALMRFLEKVEFEGDCLVWTGGRYPLGYGNFRNSGAHRYAYQQFVGPIPAGMQIDHLCRNPSCVHPFHLEAVTRRENILRGTGITALEALQTHCIHGHEFTPENTHPRSEGGRRCLTCRRKSDRERMRRKRAANRAAGLRCDGKVLVRKGWAAA